MLGETMPSWVEWGYAAAAFGAALWVTADIVIGSNRRIRATRKEGLALALLRHRDATVALAASSNPFDDADDERLRLTDGEYRARAVRVRRGNVAALRVR